MSTDFSEKLHRELFPELFPEITTFVPPNDVIRTPTILPAERRTVWTARTLDGHPIARYVYDDGETYPYAADEPWDAAMWETAGAALLELQGHFDNVVLEECEVSVIREMEISP